MNKNNCPSSTSRQLHLLKLLESFTSSNYSGLFGSSLKLEILSLLAPLPVGISSEMTLTLNLNTDTEVFILGVLLWEAFC